MEYEQVREEIAKWLHDHTVKIRQESIPWLEKTAWEDLPKDTRLDTQKAWRDKADEILSLDGIEIKADAQSLPEDPFDYASECRESTAYGEAQRDMLKADSKGRVWVRVIPKPKRK